MRCWRRYSRRCRRTICCWLSPTPVNDARSAWRLVKRYEQETEIPAITGFNPNALQQQATLCLYTIAEEQATRSAAILLYQRADDADRSFLFMGLVQQDLAACPGADSP